MQIKNVNINTIKPYDKNPRKNDAAVDKVMASLKEFGFKQPIVTDKDGIIIVGHTRYKAALKLGLTEVPVLCAEDLTPEQVQAYRLADNKTAEFAEWDMDMLAGELMDLVQVDFDMEPFGFDSEGEFIDHNQDADKSGASPWDRMNSAGQDGVIFNFGALTCKVDKSVYDRFFEIVPDSDLSEWLTEVLLNACCNS